MIKNTLKLPEDHIVFNLKLKIILSPLFDAQKAFIQKKKKPVPETFDFLVSFVPSDTKYRGIKRIEIIS